MATATTTKIIVPASLVRGMSNAWANVKSAAKGFEASVALAAEARPEDITVTEWKRAVNAAFYKAEGIRTTKTGRGLVLKVQLSQAWKAVLGSPTAKPQARALTAVEAVLRSLFGLTPAQQAKAAGFFGI